MSGLSPQERYLLDVDGYLVLEDVLSPEEVSRLNALIDARDLPVPGESIESQRFGMGFLAWDPAFLELVDHPRVLPVMRELCGDGLRLDHAYGIVMSPGTAGLGLHGGGTPFDPAQYYLVDGGRIRAGLCVASFALVDVGPGDGAFCCVPGSHKAAFPLPSPVPEGLVRQVPHRAGSVILFTEALTHGTLPWTAPFQRRHLLFKYSPGNSAWARPEALPEELLESLTPRRRRLLDPPFVGGRHPVP